MSGALDANSVRDAAPRQPHLHLPPRRPRRPLVSTSTFSDTFIERNPPFRAVCDVGGTTSDFGVLLPSGYPRRAAGDATICGVQVNYHLPLVESIGIGGGSLVRQNGGKFTVGKDSVGPKDTSVKPKSSDYAA